MPRTSPAPPRRRRGGEDFTAAVVRVLCELGSGEVVSYGEVAAQAGYPGAARAVGTLLARSEFEVPWWRVVTSTGRLGPGHESTQARLLAAEGVATAGGYVKRARRPPPSGGGSGG
ncbi:MAG TPA: MGMT family protein [Acidimicrobiales bacterium]|nr:MGMT family protein [Acidimicrobiales bacterium]